MDQEQEQEGYRDRDRDREMLRAPMLRRALHVRARVGGAARDARVCLNEGFLRFADMQFARTEPVKLSQERALREREKNANAARALVKRMMDGTNKGTASIFEDYMRLFHLLQEADDDDPGSEFLPKQAMERFANLLLRMKDVWEPRLRMQRQQLKSGNESGKVKFMAALASAAAAAASAAADVYTAVDQAASWYSQSVENYGLQRPASVVMMNLVGELTGIRPKHVHIVLWQRRMADERKVVVQRCATTLPVQRVLDIFEKAGRALVSFECIMEKTLFVHPCDFQTYVTGRTVSQRESAWRRARRSRAAAAETRPRPLLPLTDFLLRFRKDSKLPPPTASFQDYVDFHFGKDASPPHTDVHRRFVAQTLAAMNSNCLHSLGIPVCFDVADPDFVAHDIEGFDLSRFASKSPQQLTPYFQRKYRTGPDSMDATINDDVLGLNTARSRYVQDFERDKEDEEKEHPQDVVEAAIENIREYIREKRITSVVVFCCPSDGGEIDFCPAVAQQDRERFAWTHANAAAINARLLELMRTIDLMPPLDASSN